MIFQWMMIAFLGNFLEFCIYKSPKSLLERKSNFTS
jgi:hypothetical protein